MPERVVSTYKQCQEKGGHMCWTTDEVIDYGHFDELVDSVTFWHGRLWRTLSKACLITIWHQTMFIWLKMVKAFKSTKFNMWLKSKFLKFMSGLYFPANLSCVSDAHGDRFHQDLANMKNDTRAGRIVVCGLTIVGYWLEKHLTLITNANETQNTFLYSVPLTMQAHWNWNTITCIKRVNFSQTPYVIKIPTMSSYPAFYEEHQKSLESKKCKLVVWWLLV